MPKKRYRAGMMTCVILIAILIIILVLFNVLANFIYPREYGASKFYLSDRRREFSVPAYNCPVEIDISVNGGGNATFYLVKGTLEASINDIRYDEESADYIRENTLTYESDIDHFTYTGHLDSGKYTILMFRLLEVNNTAPLIVGVSEDKSGGYETLDYSTSTRIVYNRFNIFVLKP